MQKKLEIRRRNRIFPTVSLNAETGVLEIKGRSLPENADAFFNPILDWLETYIKNPAEKTIFNIHLDYYNSSSARKLTDILTIVRKIDNIIIRWFYDIEDEVMKENGIDFQQVIKKKFEFIEIDDED